MGNIVTLEANALLQSSVRGDAYTAPSGDITLALVKTASSASTPGTEVTNDSDPTTPSTYARQPITFADASAGSISNDAAVSFTNMPAVLSPGIVGIELWDSAGTPVRRWFGALTADKVINKGDTVTFNSASVIISLT